ncbi:hypothetical protein DMC47_09030 [Nostoc sp. 3335mG]|nr:hypothetical protein DMC47_09030 [Nostoc sp. 3335mG]
MAERLPRPQDPEVCQCSKPRTSGREDTVDGDRPKDGAARKVPLGAPEATGERIPFAWPWGLVAMGVLALGWVGLYLVWNGIVFLSNL